MRSTYQVGLRIALGAALVIALGGACLRTAKYGPSGADVVRFDTSQRTLPSGLRVVIENDRSSGLAGVVLTVGSGAADDPPGREGLAHLVEHLVFRSSRQGVTFWARLMEL
ncbi:MAG TPA: insulinase family protein, partial [Polyangiaceae bacterium]